jgi:hypothetical protein
MDAEGSGAALLGAPSAKTRALDSATRRSEKARTQRSLTVAALPDFTSFPSTTLDD